MNPSLVDLIKSLGLPVTWQEMRAGWRLSKMSRRLIDPVDIELFAVEQLKTTEAEHVSDVAVLATASDAEETDEALQRLAPVVSEFANRTVRAALLSELLDRLSANPIDALMALTSFWAEWGYPDDSPHVTQGRNNSMDPRSYYTSRNLSEIVAAHRTWLAKEIAQLRSKQQGT